MSFLKKFQSGVCLSWVNNAILAHNNAVNQGPNFNKMFQGPNTPLVDAATPGGGNFEPMAANEGFSIFGGSAF